MSRKKKINKCPDCGEGLALFSDGKTTKEYCLSCNMTDKQKKKMEKIEKQVEKDLKPLYDLLGVDMETESLWWYNGEVFVKNKKTGKRREIIGKNQEELNIIMFKDAMRLGKKMREKYGRKEKN